MLGGTVAVDSEDAGKRPPAREKRAGLNGASCRGAGPCPHQGAAAQSSNWLSRQRIAAVRPSRPRISMKVFRVSVSVASSIAPCSMP